MNKSFSKVLLAIIIVVQLAVPITMLSVYSVKKKEFDKNCKEIKLVVESVACEEDSFEVYNSSLEKLYDADYIVFQEKENGYFECSEASEKPGDKFYVNKNSNNGSVMGFFEYGKHNMPKNYNYYDLEYYYLYNMETELENIQEGNFQGSQTEAYMIIKVYDGQMEIKDVYINGIPVLEFYEKVRTGETDVERYNYFYKSPYVHDVEEFYDEEIGEYVSEPYG